MFIFKSKTKVKNIFLIIVPVLFISQALGQVGKSVVHPEWSYNQTIYEVNTRQFSKEGTFKAVQKEIPRLKKMGVGIIWLMPVHPIGEKNRKGTLGSYYSVKDYLAVDPAYGTIADLKSLVKNVHANNMHLIIDWVANHTAWDNKLAKEHPEYYTKDSLGNFIPPVPDWKDVIDLNYDNKGLRTYMINAMKFWLKECNIDGFRCDVADMVPTDFWIEARKELDKVKPVFMLAEAEKQELHEKCFDMTYSWGLFNIVKKIASGENNSVQLRTFFEKEKKTFPEDAFRMRFTENHDENSWNGSAIEKLGNAAEMLAVFNTVIPGMPLVYNGQEVCNTKRLNFFEKDPIQWKDCNLMNVYTKILNLKKSNNALLNGKQGGKLIEIKSDKDSTVYSFTRENGKDKIFAIFNMSSKPIDVTFEGKEIGGRYKELLTGESTILNSPINLRLNAWGYKVFVK
jgi:cyclomaltodextrinase / maltogenic alpha-amylase / neopullulanase